MTTNPEERATELPSKVGLERELHRAWSKQSRCLGCSKPAELLWPIVEQWLTQARLAALEEAAQYFLSDDYIDNQHGLGGPIDLATLVRDLKHRAQAAAPAKETGK